MKHDERKPLLFNEDQMSQKYVTRDQAKAYVQFVDYGSTSWVDFSKLRRGSCMSDLPIQVSILYL